MLTAQSYWSPLLLDNTTPTDMYRGNDRVLDTYGCCNVAHAIRTLHTKYPSNTSRAMLYIYLKEINNDIIHFTQLQSQYMTW